MFFWGDISSLRGFRHKHKLTLLLFFALCEAVACSAVLSQTYPLRITDRALENPYVLHAKNWPSTLGLPSAAIMRTNAGERWYQIETARGEYSPTFGNLFLPDTGWVDMARKHHTELLYTFNTVPAWATHQEGKAPANVAPYDIDAKDEACVAPLAGQISVTGNCIWKEWVTTLLQKDCDVKTQPPNPLLERCVIHNFETWNEFNAGLFWNDSLIHLAKMANDMATIVRAYCGDCVVVAGSTSAGGVGRGGDGPSGSGSFDIALGQFLDAWHAISNASLPNAISYHSYPSRTNVSYPPFPETNVSLNDPRCSAAVVPNPWCFDSILDQPSRLRKLIAARPYLARDTPIWNTESGWNGNKTLLHGVDANGYADAETGILRQAFLARQTILLANQGVSVNLWYEADHQCDGTLYGFGADPASQQMERCHSDPVIPVGLTPAGHALNTLWAWLHGASFTGPCQSVATIWWCPIAEASGDKAILAWTTRWGPPQSASMLPAGFKYAHTLDGNTAGLSPGEKPLLEPRPRLFDNKR
jgi:hypothetical protein